MDDKKQARPRGGSGEIQKDRYATSTKYTYIIARLRTLTFTAWVNCINYFINSDKIIDSSQADMYLYVYFDVYE